jgi:hypothetical protein
VTRLDNHHIINVRSDHLIIAGLSGLFSPQKGPSLQKRMNQPYLFSFVSFHTHPVSDAGEILQKVVLIDVTACQLCPEGLVLTHEQQRVAINRNNPGKGAIRLGF